ncbi:hypothetical protein HYFRA_00009910 [Hymenoscyphus fraxineus]|uniref:Uncharacterized protein n=1 Tax=Hymenoscyphus fraxineus TaxID=746836 RepID=A0A9N9L5N3_9HELO|nr:hypothetical protein HYFRA_00009910 [Hymenoscyphus fraxineus]
MHFSTLFIAAIATGAPFVFAEEQKHGEHNFSKSGKASGSVRPFPSPSGKPHFTVSHHAPTLKPSGHPKPSGLPKPSGVPKPSAISVSIEDTPMDAAEKPKASGKAPGKASGKPSLVAHSGKSAPTISFKLPTHSIKAHASGKPTLKPLTNFPLPSGKPKTRPSPLSTATVIPLPEETTTETSEKTKRFNMNAREIDDYESPPIIAASASTKVKPTHTKAVHSSVKSAHAVHTGKAHSIKSSPGHAHATGGFAHPSAHHGHRGGPSGFVTSKKIVTRTVSATASGKMGKPTLKAE